MRSWHQSHYGSWQLYGHHHGTLPEDRHMFSMDVGVDVHRYPWSFDEVRLYMDMKANRMGWAKPERGTGGHELED
jgi:calcineurin-like phosphoesterase family protein